MVFPSSAGVREQHAKDKNNANSTPTYSSLTHVVEQIFIPDIYETQIDTAIEIADTAISNETSTLIHIQPRGCVKCGN
ncbi:hypothetical protein E2C01_005346 [Portunus trituberculatus]|uniref:Uncharacterized protein n=1 Tax=Portunus trituberculatus TaxID=210409 RepID=A0A5B7CSJ5_PORTR|nr:hypothetical protein [Portunus trituberculatus]